MRRYLKKILLVLDGAPTPTANTPHARRGQSLVELTLVMPLLILLLLGLMEIGWLASNFLVLLDVTREAGRFGATGDPTLWPTGEEHNLERMDCNTVDGGSYVDIDGRTYLPMASTSHLPGFFVDGGDSPIGYFDGVACTVVRNMAPLVFDPSKDDVAVSVFAYVVEDFGHGAQVRITGRFPARQNECSNEPYDPFDFNRNGSYDLNEDQFRMYDGVEETGPADNDENVRGFVLTGHHQVSDAPGCIGSEFSTQEIEDLLNGVSALENEHSPNSGLVVVEVFWHHSQLLKLRWFQIIGDNFEIHAWAMFPVTAAEPTATPS
jgi:hypothetical protein